ncbi:MAG TPA: phage tail protein [Pyrinomonadaceae bacterium]|nr:phage tail protein [Pyrinomonadaceae bacterium]
MDANGTRYQLLLGKEDWWRRCTDAGGTPLDRVGEDELAAASLASIAGGGGRELLWDAERSELTLHPRVFQFIASAKDLPPPVERRRGSARDRFGNWYTIDETELRILARSEGSRRVSTFWPPENAKQVCDAAPGDFRPREQSQPAQLRFRGLAVTEDHFLVVGVVEPAGIIFFDLHAGGAPQQIVWPAESPFTPFDMTAAPGGGVHILDRERRAFWSLDRRFDVLLEGEQELIELRRGGRDDFQPRGGGPERRTAPRVFPKRPHRLEASDPVAIETMPDGSVLILDRNPSEDFCRVYRYARGRKLGPPASTDELPELIESTSAITLRGYDFAFIPAKDEGGGLGRVYVVSEGGNQSFAFAATEEDDAHASPPGSKRLSLRPLPDYLPMRLFGARGLVAAGGELFYDYGDGWIPLVEQKRPRYTPAGTLLSPVFDGREPGCVWHRLMLDACIPPETQVRVFTRAADEDATLELADWQAEPRLYLRGDGSELPFVSNPAGKDRGTWELLFQNARGRFIQLRLELSGNGRTTPRLRALRAYYPRFSYLERYLPAVYREDKSSASFLDRFLANVEGIYTTVEDRIAAAQLLFDVRSAPADALEWLAGWLGATLDPTWDDRRRRLFIKHAAHFFHTRGTVRGLRSALRLALDACPDDSIFDDDNEPRGYERNGVRIVERFGTRKTPAVMLGDPTEGLGDGTAAAGRGRWAPAQGTDVLHKRYREHMLRTFGPYRVGPFPVRHPGRRRLHFWRGFAQDVLGFVPASADAERRRWQNFLCCRYKSVADLNKAHGTAWRRFVRAPLPADVTAGSTLAKDWQDYLDASKQEERGWWQDYLARRYHNVAALNLAHGTRWPSFGVVSLFDELPTQAARLHDWYQFEALVLPMRRAAHRFTVLLPMPAAESLDSEKQRRRLDLARRIVNLEKPAHTVFDVKFYWAMFRVGEARVGSDTLLHVGSRAPQLMPPMVLGREHLAASYISPTHPQDVPDRQSLGFVRLGA